MGLVGLLGVGELVGLSGGWLVGTNVPSGYTNGHELGQTNLFLS